MITVSTVRRMASEMLRQVRPLRSIIRHIVENDEICNSGHLKHYVSDIADHTEEILVDLTTVVTELDAWKLDFAAKEDRRMNRLLYVLTIVTTSFMPIQTLSGMFGMNFVKVHTTTRVPRCPPARPTPRRRAARYTGLCSHIPSPPPTEPPLLPLSSRTAHRICRSWSLNTGMLISGDGVLASAR